MPIHKITPWQHVRYIPLLSALTFSRWRRFETRSRALGSAVGWAMRWFAPARRRFEREIVHVYPDMPSRARAHLSRDMGRNMGRTLFEILHCAEFQDRHAAFTASGPGLATLRQAKAAGKGAIIVSGHFGQWEAVRAVLKAQGMETGAVYRRQPNRHYQRRLLAGIEAGGKPILETGAHGTKALVRHLRAGGFIAILLDEKYAGGAQIPFLGRPALTSLAAAELALRYGLPMVPAYGTRTGDGNTFDVDFEEAITPTDALTMTRAFNDSLSARIRSRPEQWYWLLRRWQSV